MTTNKEEEMARRFIVEPTKQYVSERLQTATRSLIDAHKAFKKDDADMTWKGLQNASMDIDDIFKLIAQRLEALNEALTRPEREKLKKIARMEDRLESLQEELQRARENIEGVPNGDPA